MDLLELELWVAVRCPTGCWERNSSPPREKDTRLTAESSLQPAFSFFTFEQDSAAYTDQLFFSLSSGDAHLVRPWILVVMQMLPLWSSRDLS